MIMANDTDDAAASSRPVSPTVGVKREHSDDEEESARRVSQRTETSNNNDDEAPSMKQLVLKGLQSDDQALLVQALDHVWKKMKGRNDPYAVEARKEFYQLGGHVVVVTGVMEKHPNNEGIQFLCILLICDATCNDNDLKISFALVDGMQAILAAMDQFPNNRWIQRNGIAALTNMTLSNDSNATTLVQDLNGIPIIIGIMDRFSNDEKVAEKGCKALRWLCRVEELRQPIFDTNAFTALAKARDSFKENNVIKQLVKEATKHFVSYCDAT